MDQESMKIAQDLQLLDDTSEADLKQIQDYFDNKQ